MIAILQNTSLKDKNTFAVDSKAKYYAEIENEYQIHSLLETNAFQESRRYFLGEGSNTLFVDDFDGIVVRLANEQFRIVENTKSFVIVEVGAGLQWHRFVQVALNNKFYGLENLALIPGAIGGAVTQNIGAYGVELNEFVEEVRGVDINSGEFVNLPNQECKFGYRTSIFKTLWKGRFLITSAKFRLLRKPRVNLTYPELSKSIKKLPFIKPSPEQVFETVVKLRQMKLPDMKVYPNAGSFFKNPIINAEALEKLKNKYPDVPSFQVDDNNYKVPAGWLIERAGWKGKRIGNVGTYDKHALVIVNYGVSKGKEILEFARNIQQDIKDKFDIDLEFEVEIVE